ncbi:transcriptional regulator [Adhaeribacter aerolatus]|uniref:Transcriptional regulator n=1 Tax=Adhaeribacter aerolatus TaxID=670289 RepID=A0A512B5F1_9BACT|nr:response regulator [Adhaeribacter aerolatus]GEO07164.1 transcriptional regulator [Adhaeribacter aerolatus]
MSLAKKTVLLIEDNQDIRESTSEILAMADFTVYTAENGKKGVELAQANPPDIILCDIMMPEMDGYSVLYLLRKNESTVDIPFIFLTAKSERADMRKGMEMGADDYLTKPFNDLELLNAIETRLQKRGRAIHNVGNATSFEGLRNEAKSAKLLNELSGNSRLHPYKKKQNIYLEGDHAVTVYLVKSGQVRTYMTYQNGREIISGIFTPGDFLGYESVLLNMPYAENAEALDAAELYLIPKNEFNALLFKDAGIANKFIQLLSGNIQEKQEQLLKLAYNSVRKRVADALINLAEKYHGATTETCEIKVSREDLASMVGTANETISRTLADFKSEKLIQKEGSTIRVLSMEKLRKIKQ